MSGAIAASYGVAAYFFNEFSDMKERQHKHTAEVEYMQKTLDNCVKRDVYEIEKMLLIEKLSD